MLICKAECDGPYLDYSILTEEAGDLVLEASLIRLQSETLSQKTKGCGCTSEVHSPACESPWLDPCMKIANNNKATYTSGIVQCVMLWCFPHWV